MKAFKINKYTLWLMATLFLSLPFSCTREFDDLELATFPSNGDVFLDDFSGGLEYAAFAGSKILAFQVDGTEGYESDAAMRFAVPEPDDPEGSYAGGQFFTSGARDLSGFNVLTFWAKASQPANLDVLGFGNIAEQTTAVTLAAAKVNTNWQQFMIPIPDPSKLMEESSLFFYSEGAEDGSGYTFWIDEIQFERVDGLENPRPTMFNGAEQTITAETGDSISLRDNLNLTHNLPSGVDQTTTTAPGYYNFTSSDPSVATVNNGVVTVLDAGTTVITATLAGQEVAGSLIVESTGEALLPPTAAPTPTVSPDSVISMFSNVYDNVTVDTWNPLWEFSTAQVQDVKIGDDDVKRYKELNFVGILTETEPLDVSAMTHFHIDIWTPDNTDPPAAFRTLLVDFGANEAFGGGDDSSHELTFTSPTLKTGEWVSLDIPLSSFTDLVSRQNIAQLVLSGDIPNVFVDNVYYYIKAEPTLPSEPTVAAPTPTQDAANVVSLFSDAYTDATVDTWRTDWSAADYEEVTVAGDATKKYANLDFVGIETVSNTVDASAMSHLHLDLWSSNHTFFGIKLVDFGADGAFGGGDDVEHQLNFESPLQGEWLSLDIPLDDFTDLTTRSNIGQYILVGQPTGATTLYVDNMFFYGEGGGSGATEPMVAAPTPTQDAANVVSLFSDAYTDATVDTWRTDWSAADYEEVMVAGDATKKYANLDFVGIETVATPVDASAMSHLHLDLWSADYTLFGIKLVDFGADGAFGGGDDVEHQLNFESPLQGEWLSLDIPLDDFTDLTTRSNIAQYILVGQPTGTTTLYVDNMFFYGEGGGSGVTEPTVAAPMPIQDAANVVSLFSDAYTDVPVDTWRTDWSAADYEEVMVADNATKKYANLDFVGIETVATPVDASAMSHLHLDLWSADYTLFGIKLVDFGADGAFGGGDDVEHQINFDAPLQGDWLSLDIPLDDFTDLTTRSNIAQYILVGQPTGTTTVYVDNMYFYK